MGRKKIILLTSMLSIMFLISSIVVYAKTSVTVTNNFTTGIVDIELNEYQLNTKGKEEPWKNKTSVLPGDKISKIPRVTNNGNDCYIRTNITIRDTKEITESDIYGMSKDFVKANDGYYYYKKILKQNDSIDIFKGINIPDNFNQTEDNITFYIDIDVDAIQSNNFTMDLNDTNPWGNVEILKNDKDVITYQVAHDNNLKITYQGDTEKLIKNRDDFFINIPTLVPGDKYTDVAKLENNSKQDIKLYFKSVATDKSDILDKLKLKISTNNTTYYEGTLRAEQIKDNGLLCTIPAKDTVDLNFEIEMPKELNNKYSAMASNVQWIFSTDVITDIPNDPPKLNPPVKTGDEFKLLLPIMLFSISVIMLCITVILKIKNRKEQK